MPAPTVDLKNTHHELYSATTEPALVEVPELPFLYVDGRADIASREYTDSVEALYVAAHEVRACLEASQILMYSVMPLESLWWASEGRDFRSGIPDAAWAWRVMIMQPEELDVRVLGEALDRAKHVNRDIPLDLVRLERINEGASAQILHTGSTEHQAGAVEKLHEFAREHDGWVSGPHHEIHLSDPRHTPPGQLETILRYAVSQ